MYIIFYNAYNNIVTRTIHWWLVAIKRTLISSEKVNCSLVTYRSTMAFVYRIAIVLSFFYKYNFIYFQK